MTLSHSTSDEVRQLFETASRLKIGSAYAGAWGNLSNANGETVYAGKVSHAAQAPLVTEKTIFDLASLTKVIATTSLVMKFVEAGQLELDAPLEKYLPVECKKNPTLKALTLRLLLSHTSGLPAWRAYYEELKVHFGSNLPFISIQQRKEYFYGRLFATQPDALPGERMVYSDVGFLMVGVVLEKISGLSEFNDLFQEMMNSLNLSGNTLHFRPVVCDAAGAIDQRVAATEVCPWRGWLQGQVHDDNTWSMGGIAPHAGLFGTLNDVVGWVRALMLGGIASQSILNQFFTEVNITPPGGASIGARRTVGFDMPSFDGSGTTANAFSGNSIGHLGFSGTSIWIDLDTGDYACLLTNRVHPHRNDLRIKNLRRSFHTLVRIPF